jgi:hypothetical protein
MFFTDATFLTSNRSGSRGTAKYNRRASVGHVPLWYGNFILGMFVPLIPLFRQVPTPFRRFLDPELSSLDVSRDHTFIKPAIFQSPFLGDLTQVFRATGSAISNRRSSKVE